MLNWPYETLVFLLEQNLIQTYSLENLLGERKKAHQVMLTGKPYLDADSCSSSEEGDDENHKNFLKELVGLTENKSITLDRLGQGLHHLKGT